MSAGSALRIVGEMPEAVPVLGDKIERDLIAFVWKLWLSCVENILAVGDRIIADKARIEHGRFQELIETTLPFSASTARRLMIVASHPLLSNRAHVHVLPPSWGTLYELTKVPEPTLEAALTDGRVTPGMERHQATRLWQDEASRPEPTYAIFLCPSCNERQLLRSDSRPSSLGEDLDVQSRLYECAACDKTTLTEERVVGPFRKRTLPKSSREAVGA